MSSPLISVIIPYFNHGKYIQECLDSVFNSSYKNIEVLIINDGSDDLESVRIIENIEQKYPQIQVIKQSNAGPSHSRNKGIELAKGEYFVFLDGDDIMMENTINHCLSVFEKHSDCCIVYGNNEHFGEDNFIRHQSHFKEQSILIYNSIAICTMVKRAPFDQGIRFDQNLSKLGLEDWELWIQLSKSNYKFYYIDETLFRIRVLKKSRTTESANKKIDEIKAYIHKKHSAYIAQKYQELFYQKKQLLETPDYKLGNLIMSPYRLMKKIFS